MVDIFGRGRLLLTADTSPIPRDLEKVEPEFEKAGEEAGEAYAEGQADGYKKGSKEFDSEVDRTGARSTRTMRRHGARAGQNFGDGFWRRARTSFSAPFGKLDNTVQLVVAALAATFSEAAALTSGLSAGITAIASSLAFAGASLASFTALLPALGGAIAFAVAGLKEIDQFAPRAAEGFRAIAEAAENVGLPAFMAEWEESLGSFATALETSINFEAIGASLGAATARITEAFTAVIESPAWTGFLNAMQSTLPQALGNLGEAAASFSSVLLNLFTAASGPLADMTAEFAVFGDELATTIQQAQDSGALADFFERAAESLGLTLDLIRNLGSAFGNVFGVGQVFGNSLLQIFIRLAERFDAFTASVAGQNALTEWFAQGMVIIRALLPLIGQIATSIANLITPTVVQQLAGFIGSLTNFIPILEQVLALAASLNVFGILAALLDAVRVALEPVMPLLHELAVALGEAIIQAIVAITPLLTELVAGILAIIPAIIELLPSVVSLIQSLVDGLLPILIDILPQLVKFSEIILDSVIVAVDLLIPILDILFEILEVISQFLVGTITPAFDSFSIMVETVEDVVDGFVENALKPAREWLGRLNERIRNTMDRFGSLGGVIGDTLQRFGRFIGNGIQRAQAAISTLTGRVRALARGIGNAVGGAIESFRRILRDIGGAIGDVAGRISGFIRGALANLSGAFSDIRGVIQPAIDLVWDLITALGNISFPTPPSWLTSGFGAITNLFAEGGVVTGPTRALIGEAGPEMVVPLARPLSQVDPAVREVAAFAQGQTSFANGGIAGGGITVAPGAIQVVSPYANPRLVADEVLDELVLAGK